MTVAGTYLRNYRISTEASADAASPGAKAEWTIGGNGGGANGWMDYPVSKDTDGLQFKIPPIYPTPMSGTRAMNTADPIAGAYSPELGSLPSAVWPEFIDRLLYATMGGVARVETAGAAALASTAFASVATLDTQPNGTEQLKFVIASSTAAASAAINIIQSAVIQETITIGTNAGTVNGTYYSKGAYNGSVNAITFSIAGSVTNGMVTVSGVDKVTSTFTWGATSPTLAIEQAGRQEAGSGNSEFFTGVIVPTLAFNYDRSAADGLLLCDATFHGMNMTAATKTTYQNDTAKYTRPFAGWTGAVTIDGAATAEVVSGSWTLQSNNSLYAVSSGTQKSTGQIPGEYEVFGELVVLPADGTRWTDYTAATNRILVLNFQTPFYVVDTTKYQLQFTFTRIFVQDYTRNRQNQAQGATIAFRGVYNATDAGACKVVKVDRMPV